ncbi:DinB family protein [Candidatus Sulfopaludibacter sp. SbA6]|nr:DinB family protein [Candidatus Sulfopaludibacter sp. SbA6]
MQGYNAQDMARSFRTVRANTITIAEEIPEESYGFRPAEGSRSVAETLAHIAVTPRFAQRLHGDRITALNVSLFAEAMPRIMAEEAALTTTPKILDALRTGGEEFAAFLETLSDEALDERVHMPPGMEPASKTRFEMLLGAKEHEMHHRAQLMVAERMLGIVPHLTRNMQARMAQFQQQQQQKAAAG